MPTPNYGFEKRQRELAKRQKKEEKLRAKAERKTGSVPHADSDDEATPPGEPRTADAPPGTSAIS